MTGPRPRWRIACSCGWTREASSAWAATAIARLHARYLVRPGTDHVISIKKPPADPPSGQQLTLT